MRRNRLPRMGTGIMEESVEGVKGYFVHCHLKMKSGLFKDQK